MKKKVLIIITLGLIISFPFLKNIYNKVTTPDKILVVGKQVSDDRVDFIREIKDREEIVKYETFFDNIVFSRNEWDTDAYPDIILTLKHKEGYGTHSLNIWINESVALRPNTSGSNSAKLSNQQLKELREIIE